MLPGELRTLQADIENKNARLEKIKSEIKSANFDERLSEKVSKAKMLDDKRDQLTAEFRTLSMQSDTRIRLGVKATELKAKLADVNNMYASSESWIFLWISFPFQH
jgi:DNA repair protein RAD50